MIVRRSLVLAAAAVLLIGGCAAEPQSRPSPAVTSPAVTPSATARPTTAAPTPQPTPTESTSAPSGTPTQAPGTVPPVWLGTRILPTDDPAAIAALRTPPALQNRQFTLPDTVPMLPGNGFQSEVTSPAPAKVIARSTWETACPVGARDLAWIRLTFHGFDGTRHTGELLVNASAAFGLVRVFRDLWEIDFPMEQMTITTRAERDAAPTGDGNDTGAFNCRAVTGGSSYSEHARGLAIDLNPFQNPYLKGDVVLPELARSYLERGDVRPGMITDRVVQAFARIGWGWGGSWRSLKDYQHFSANNR